MDLLEIIAKYWPFLGAVITFIVGYAVLRAQSNNQEGRLTRLEGKVEAFNPVFLQIQKDLVEIKTTIMFIRESTTKIIKQTE